MAKVISIVKRSGVYNDKPWNNYQITTARESDSDNVVGLYCETHKVKCDVLDQYLSDHSLSLKSIINKDIDVAYNKYGRVEYINIH